MIDADAIRQLSDANQPETFEINGRERLLAPEGWEDLTPKPPQPPTIGASTLDGVIAYLIANTDKLPLDQCLLLVRPTSVLLVGRIEDVSRDFIRTTFIEASYRGDMQFGVFLMPEDFIVKLSSLFVPTPEREKLLQLVSSMREGSVRETLDDGISQEVKTQKGVALVSMSKVPNPITLKPYRTFTEIDQPESQFVVRVSSTAGLDQKPLIALFEAEGRAWEKTAVDRIRDYLESALRADQPIEGEPRRFPPIIA